MYKTGDNYGISTGNYIKNDKIEVLTELIEKANSLNKVELKQLYLQKLRDAGFTDSGGAGAGIVDVARLLSEKIKYKFTNLNNNISFFTLNVVI